MEIAGATAFVTGAASGIGLAIARALIEAGARVAMADIDAAELAEAVDALGEAAMAVPLDVTDRAAWNDARERVETRFGPIGILVNNAGIGPQRQPLDATPPEHFDRMVAIKLTGTYNGVRTFVPAMRAAGRGHVINTASMAGLVATAGLGAYTATKFAVVGLSEVMRAELAEAGIGVSVLCPGLVRTSLGRNRDGTPSAAAAATMAQALDPAVVGAQVIEAIRTDRALVVTHPERRAAVAARLDTVLAAFDQAAHNQERP